MTARRISSTNIASAPHHLGPLGRKRSRSRNSNFLVDSPPGAVRTSACEGTKVLIEIKGPASAKGGAFLVSASYSAITLRITRDSVAAPLAMTTLVNPGVKLVLGCLYQAQPRPQPGVAVAADAIARLPAGFGLASVARCPGEPWQAPP